jgi:hypothetical protein
MVFKFRMFLVRSGGYSKSKTRKFNSCPGVNWQDVRHQTHSLAALRLNASRCNRVTYGVFPCGREIHVHVTGLMVLRQSAVIQNLCLNYYKTGNVRMTVTSPAQVFLT